MSDSPKILRHEFYETDEKVEISIVIKDILKEETDNKDKFKIDITSRSVVLKYEEKQLELSLEPLKGEIIVDHEETTYRTVQISPPTSRKVKVVVDLVKKVHGRWGQLVGEPIEVAPAPSTSSPVQPDHRAPPKKNWDTLAETALKATGSEKTTKEDPNAGGDAALNSFFQQIYAGADEDAKRAMMKSYSESGGTTLSTNWDDVKKGKVEVKPPSGAEYKKL